MNDEKQKKPFLSKKTKVIAVLLLAVAVGLGIWLSLKDGVSISGKTIQGKDTTVLAYFNSLAEEYGASFTKVTKTSGYVHAFSRNFDQLTNEQKTRFFLKVGKSITLSSGEEFKLIPDWGGWPGFFVLCHGHRYSIEDNTNHGGYVELFDVSLAGTGRDSTLYKLQTKPMSSSSDSAGRKNSAAFTNKYGTPTTKCAHTGCNNYIASSGDTNCCTIHSRKCGNCGKYIDEDALFCMDCLEEAIKKR